MTGVSAVAESMSVSIIAGPRAGAVIEKLSGITLFEQISGSTPEQLIHRLRQIGEKGGTNQLIIPCEPERPVMAYASLFADPATSLSKFFRLTSVAFAIDAAALLDVFLDRKVTSVPACFVAEQLEFASDIFLDGANGPDFELARSIATALNPRARVLSLIETDAAVWNKRRGTTFDFELAMEGAGWRKLLDDEQSGSGDNVTGLGYSSRRPFHPERFANLLQKGLGGVFRAKGFFWLATRMDEVGGLNLAGPELQCASAGHWWAARDESQMPERTRQQWQEPFGDRRQSFAIMALGVERDALQRQLDGCLLTENEMAQGEAAWRQYPDPFPSWTAHSHSHEHHHDCECDHDHGHESDHDHGSHEHDCCG